MGLIVFDREHMTVEIGDPLLAFLGQPWIGESVPYVGLDHLPEEAGIAVLNVGRAVDAKLVIGAGFEEFVLERVLHSEVVGSAN